MYLWGAVHPISNEYMHSTRNPVLTEQGSGSDEPRSFALRWIHINIYTCTRMYIYVCICIHVYMRRCTPCIKWVHAQHAQPCIDWARLWLRRVTLTCSTVNTFKYIYVYMYVYICMFVHTCIYEALYTLYQMSTCIARATLSRLSKALAPTSHAQVLHGEYIYIYTHIHICIYIYTHIYIYIYVYTCMYMDTYCVVSHIRMWRGAFICVTRRTHRCDLTHSYVWHGAGTCVTWLIYMCQMTHWYVCHNDSRSRAPWWINIHIHTYTYMYIHVCIYVRICMRHRTVCMDWEHTQPMKPCVDWARIWLWRVWCVALCVALCVTVCFRDKNNFMSKTRSGSRSCKYLVSHVNI